VVVVIQEQTHVDTTRINTAINSALLLLLFLLLLLVLLFLLLLLSFLQFPNEYMLLLFKLKCIRQCRFLWTITHIGRMWSWTALKPVLPSSLEFMLPAEKQKRFSKH
jgi:hypothetical protein